MSPPNAAPPPSWDPGASARSSWDAELASQRTGHLGTAEALLQCPCGDCQGERREGVCQWLEQVAAEITAGLLDGSPLGELVWRADGILRPAVLEVCKAALGDER